MRDRLLIRCDASAELGVGHLMRCLVLAAAWGGDVVFAMRRPAIAHERVLAAGHRIEWIDADDPAALASLGARWAVVDCYSLGAAYLEGLAVAGLRTLAIDDIATHPFPTDVLVNQNSNAAELGYVTRPDTRRLLGPRFALVRDAYRRARPARPTARAPQRILVSFGGSDPEDRTAAILEALAPLADRMQIVAVVGTGYTGRARSDRHGIVVHRDLPDLVDVMRDSQLLIGAGGSTVWEACCLGLPMILQPFADNQRGIVASLVRLGAARDASALDRRALAELVSSLQPDELGRLSAAAWDLVDGLGAARIVEAMQ